MSRTRKSGQSDHRVYEGEHRFEHWYRDNQVYFITARCREKFPAFGSEEAKTVFWAQFERYTAAHGFTPWITSLMDNHYHTLGYLRVGVELSAMMRHLHGSVAKLVNDVIQAGGLQSPCLTNGRLLPFWRNADTTRDNYFDGCIRNERQCRRAYRYTMLQAVRHGVVTDYRLYPHTRVYIELERGVRRALELGAFLEGVRYKRYDG